MTVINFPAMHPSQKKIAGHPARFRVIAAGRRWGKSRLGSALCVATALNGGRAWWIAPSYPVANVGWRMIRTLVSSIPGCHTGLADRVVVLPSGGEVRVRSADNPDSLRGEGLDLVILDECAFMKEAAWAEALRPSLSDRKGKAVFISTPKGRGWFYRLWQRCIDEHDREWQGWQLPTSDNPYIDPAEIEAARRSLPERVFQQEYLAMFLDDAGGVFRGVLEAATAEPQDGAIGGHTYTLGVDWARERDFTAIAAYDATLGAIVALDRFNQIDYQIQLGRLTALYERFRPSAVVAEANSIGQPLIEQLQRQGLPVVPFTTTNASKQVMVDALGLAFENRALSIIPDPVLIAELQAYQGERLAGGLMRYGAPSGMHDDTVMAVMLAYQNLQPATVEVSKYVQLSYDRALSRRPR